MLLDEGDQGLSRSVLSAFAWASPDLSRLPSKQALCESLAQVLHWEGLQVFVLLPDAQALTVACVRAEAGRTRAMAEKLERTKQLTPELAERVRACSGQAAPPRAGCWDGSPSTPDLRWCAVPVELQGRTEALLVLEGRSLGPLTVRALESISRFVSAQLLRIRETRELTGRLETSQRMQRKVIAEERLSVLGEAATVFAHEVRHPLSTLSNTVTLLERAGGADGTLLGILREETDRLESLVRHLLHVARPLEPRCAPLDLAELAKETLHRVQGRSHFPELQFRLDAAPQPVQVLADAGLLGLALENLLRNAAQAAPPRSEVRVVVSGDSAQGSVAVEDGGPGIPLENRPRIFEPFFTTRAVGTGLGLPIVKRIVDAHGGVVRLGKSPSGGARFELVLSRA